MKKSFLRLVLTLIAFVILHSTFCLRVSAQGTAFTYQGRLNDGATPANGSYDLQFAVYDAAVGGSKQAPFITNAATAVSNGLFTVTLDFGPGVFPGAARWLDIGVRTNGGVGFTLLSPRQALTATPYAVFAGGASNLVGAVSSANLAGTYSQAVTLNNPGNVFTGNGTGVTNVNAATLNGLGSGSFWRLDGNTVSAGQFLGSTNNQPVDFKVNGYRGFRLEPGFLAVPNVIGGATVNYVSFAVGSVIAGGGADNYFGLSYTNGIIGSFGFIGGGGHNTIDSGDFSVLGGGQDNSIRSHHSFLGGGQGNALGGNSWDAVLGGGEQNSILSSTHSFIGGGYQNSIGPAASWSTIGGGQVNHIQAFAYDATIGGGNQNTIQTNGLFSTLSGGFDNTIGVNNNSSTIGGGSYNFINDDDSYSTISGGYFNGIYNTSSYNTIGGGAGNYVLNGAKWNVIGGGLGNFISNYSTNSVIGGGYGNSVGGTTSTIGGGTHNQAGGEASTIGGGYYNSATNNSATVAGGYQNSASGALGAVGGGYYNYASGYSATVGGGYVNSASGLYATVGGGGGNHAQGFGATIGGGEDNTATNDNATVAGGYLNSAIGIAATVGGGERNGVSSDYATVAGGFYNSSAGYGSSIGGGVSNSISALAGYVTIAGGLNNIANGNFSTVGGGYYNQAYGVYATIPGGFGNVALDYCFAAGRFAYAGYSGSFVWADSVNHVFNSDGSNTFSARATGGVRFVTGVDGAGNPNAGVSLAAGGTAWATISDQNAKKNFTPVQGAEVLDKLAAVPVQKWNYKWENDSATPNIGPMAQAFKSAFYPGRDDKSITTLEFDGVELAAIQGLNEKVEIGKQKAEMERQELKAENAELKAQLNELKVLVSQLAEGKQK